MELQPIAERYPLLPVGWGKDGKGPMLKEWQRHPGFSIAELQALPGIRAVGVRTNPLLCFDFDGQSAVEYAISNGRNPSDVRTWRIDRDNDPWRFKLIFLMRPHQLAALPDRRISYKHKTKHAQVNDEGMVIRKAEAEEIFCHPARQVIVLGDHISSGGHYFWPDEAGPDAISELPPHWWEYVVNLARGSLSTRLRPAQAATGRGENWYRINQCPICGRGPSNNPVCQLHRDGKTLRCFVGSTFHPPCGLLAGDIASGTEWVFSRLQSVGWGEFAIFVKDRTSPIAKLRRWIHG